MQWLGNMGNCVDSLDVFKNWWRGDDVLRRTRTILVGLPCSPNTSPFLHVDQETVDRRHGVEHLSKPCTVGVAYGGTVSQRTSASLRLLGVQVAVGND